MAIEVPAEKTSILDELMSDESPVEETPVETTEDEKIIPDHEFKLNEEDEDEEETTEEESEEETEKVSDEDEEQVVDLDDESELELAKIPKRQEIKAAYPDIFKKFPQLEHALYREQAFTEVFPTVNDAKQAKEEIDQFNGFQSELLDGNVEGVFRSVKNADPKAFDKIASNVLDALVRVDPNAHLHITTQVTKGMIAQLHYLAGQSLEKNPDDKRAQQLQIAAEIFHNELFNTTKVTPFQQVQQQQQDPERAKFNQERQEFEKSRFTTAFNTVSSRTNNTLTAAVTRDIDTKGVLPPYVKSTVIKDVMNELDRQLVSDRPFKALVDKLWLKAKDSNYSDESLKNIDTALKNKAKMILPGIMKAKKGEAMKGLSSAPQKKEVKRELSRNTTGDKRTTPNQTLNKRDGDRLQRRPGESKLDFLMRD